MEYETLQLKFASGNEIVCQVLEWPEEGSNQLIVRNALAIVNIEIDDTERMYMFVPWLHFVEGEKDYIVVNTDHVMASSRPNPYLQEQYKLAVHETNLANKNRVKDYNKRKKEVQDRLEQAIDRVMSKKNEPDTVEDPSNVVKFPGPSNDDIIH